MITGTAWVLRVSTSFRKALGEVVPPPSRIWQAGLNLSRKQGLVTKGRGGGMPGPWVKEAWEGREREARARLERQP